MVDELSVGWTGIDGRSRRWTIIPDTSGRESWRIEHEWTPTAWREVGREPISDVELVGAAVEKQGQFDSALSSTPVFLLQT